MSDGRKRKSASLLGIAELTNEGWVFVLSSRGRGAGLSWQRTGAPSDSQVGERAEGHNKVFEGTRTLARLSIVIQYSTVDGKSFILGSGAVLR